nr:hypothetical protein [Tanacetum cinerariifolium]
MKCKRSGYRNAELDVMPTWHGVARRYDTGGCRVTMSLVPTLQHQRFKSNQERIAAVHGEAKKASKRRMTRLTIACCFGQSDNVDRSRFEKGWDTCDREQEHMGRSGKGVGTVSVWWGCTGRVYGRGGFLAGTVVKGTVGLVRVLGYLKGMEDLTKDVMWDVLSRLDFKTVSCCQCVCKRWRDLVLDPYFINNLLWSNSKNPSLMINDTTFHQLGRLKWIEIQDKVVEVEKEQLVDVVTIHDVGLSNQRFLGPFPDFEVIIGSSVNGLICVWNASGNTYIVNPIAKQYLTLPDHQSCSLDLV